MTENWRLEMLFVSCPYSFFVIFQSLFDIIREAQKRREMRKAVGAKVEEEAVPKSETIVKPEESSKRPERHWI